MRDAEHPGYRHSRHAGNAADVHKHAVLAWIVNRLASAGGPLCILDTHAGDGLYRLEAGRRHLISRLREDRHRSPALEPYRRVLDAWARSAGEETYPGSPLLLHTLMGADDSLLLADTHPDAIDALRHRFDDDPRVTMLDGDGWAALEAWRTDGCVRGLALVDPPYDSDTDYLLAGETMIGAAARRGPGVCLCLWYPLAEGPHQAMLETLNGALAGRSLHAELRFPPSATGGMRGSGLFIVHPPDGLDAAIPEIGSRLGACLACL